jgi:hypothetical protein
MTSCSPPPAPPATSAPPAVTRCPPGTLEKLKAAYELVKNGTVVPAANFNKLTPEDSRG